MQTAIGAAPTLNIPTQPVVPTPKAGSECDTPTPKTFEEEFPALDQERAVKMKHSSSTSCLEDLEDDVEHLKKTAADLKKTEVPIWKPNFLFEAAWEVCNKVGGIYTVIRSKAQAQTEKWGDRVCLIGPYFPATAETELEEMTPTPSVALAIKNTQAQLGVKIHFGKWLINGNPKCILFEVNSDRDWKHRNEALALLWESNRISIPDHDKESMDVVLFGFYTAKFLANFTQTAHHKTIAHFHEWQSGVGQLLVAHLKLPVATVFTTHATMLGRYLCAEGKFDFYNNLPAINAEHEAHRFCIAHRHRIEQQCAQGATVFTTVSDVTKWEAQYTLGRQAEYILPNGLQLDKTVAALHEFQVKHAASKEIISEFVRGHFYGPSMKTIDTDKILYLFTAGRYEFLNKGVDMFLEALAILNRRLRAEGSDITVVAFLIMPAKTAGYNVDTLTGSNIVRKMRDSIQNILPSISERMNKALLHGELPKPAELISADEMITLKRSLLASRRSSLPPVVTHNMVEEGSDQVLEAIRRLGLINNLEDRVKVVFHPQFVNAANPVLPLDYDQFTRGCHLGVFCSYYEPWGYTPAECAVAGVPSISSNLSGFAKYIENNHDLASREDSGIFIVDRHFKAPHESIDQLADIFYKFTKMTRRQRIEMRNKCERLSQELDWDILTEYYETARSEAELRAFPSGPLQQL